MKGELVKITVAVKNHRKGWYHKQVAVHGVTSRYMWVKDLEYNYIGMGYRVGWYAEGIQKYPKWFERNYWCDAKFKYYNPCSVTVNPEYVDKFPEFKYSAHGLYRGNCLITYLRLYKKYPQAEYLLKLGLSKLHNSVTVLKRIVKDKRFCKWLILHQNEIALSNCYVWSVIESYKTGKSIKRVQELAKSKKLLRHTGHFTAIKELFGSNLERFFSYLDAQEIELYSYMDYVNACRYLGLDMTLEKNLLPHDFKRWHDIRIDQYHAAKAETDKRERAEFYAQFAAVAGKYASLQHSKNGLYAVVIATSPAELVNEGKLLEHCVGKMNYDKKMAREETLIFFVRQLNAPDMPFVTVEYSIKTKKVLQCYGYKSEKPDESVTAFVNKVWLPYANKKLNKLNKEDKAA
jgi:hypothetical protein